MTKHELIKHCERQIIKHRHLPLTHSHEYIIEHTILLELLQGRDVNEMFDENGEYNGRID